MLKTIFLNFGKISRKLSTTESDNSNVAGATLLKSLSIVDILLPILQEFRNIFLKKHLKKTAEATCNDSTFKQPPKVFYKDSYS